MRMKNVHENTFKLIQIHCYDFTQWDSQQWWLILFCTGDIVHNVKTTIMSFEIIYKLTIQKIDHRHNENKMQKYY